MKHFTKWFEEVVMKSMKTVVLNFTDCKYLGEMHQIIGKAFDLVDWYGQNWSAFHDLLRGECDADEIIIIGLNTLPKELEGHVTKMKNILQYEQEKRTEHGEKLNVRFIDTTDSDVEQFKF